jgi:hypothetical protein
MKSYTLSAAFVAAFGMGGVAGWQASDTDMATMQKEVDAYRAAEVKAKEEAGQFREEVPTEIAKALAAAVPDKRLLSGESCKVVDGRVFCQLEQGTEVQFPASLTAKLSPEVADIKAEYEAAVAAKVAEEEARLAQEAADKAAAEEAAKTEPVAEGATEPKP